MLAGIHYLAEGSAGKNMLMSKKKHPNLSKNVMSLFEPKNKDMPRSKISTFENMLQGMVVLQFIL